MAVPTRRAICVMLAPRARRRMLHAVPLEPASDRLIPMPSSPSMPAPSPRSASMRCAEATRARRANRSSESSPRARRMPRVHRGLAYACRRLERQPPALAAADKALALEPRNLRALILKADHLAALGDARAASRSTSSRSRRRAAGHRAARPTLRDELARARAMCERYAGEFESFLLERLRGSGLADGPRGRAFPAVARHPARQEEDLLPAAAGVLLPGVAADPVLRPAGVSRGSTRSRPRPPTIRAELLEVLQGRLRRSSPTSRAIRGDPARNRPG